MAIKQKVPSPSQFAEQVKQQEEKKLADKLSKKYGQGSLDVETGTFTPTK